MQSQAPFRIHLVPLLWLVSGCGSSSDPDPTANSTYVLTRVSGDALPTELASNEVGQTRVYADTVRLAADGTGSSSGVTEFVPLAPAIPAVGPQGYSRPLHYRVGTNRIEIDWDCPPNANCIAPPHLIATVHNGGLQVQWGPQMRGREPMEYVRVE